MDFWYALLLLQNLKIIIANTNLPLQNHRNHSLNQYFALAATQAFIQNDKLCVYVL